MRESETLIPDALHERTDIGEGFIWGALGVVLGTLILCALLVLWLYPQARVDRTLRLPLPLFPEPRLQVDSPADMQRFYAQQLQRLNGAGWVDQAHTIVHIPIAQAMRETVQQGIADWPAAADVAGSSQSPSVGSRGAASATISQKPASLRERR